MRRILAILVALLAIGLYLAWAQTITLRRDKGSELTWDEADDNIAILDARAPSTDQKAALAGTNGMPSASNKYVTNSDPRMTHTVREEDGSPTVANVTEIRVSNGTLTNNGGGIVTLSTGGTGGTPGSSITLDLGDDGGNDSTTLGEIATTGDTNSIFTEPSADKLLIDLTKAWPLSDAATALAADPVDCSAGSFPRGINASGIAVNCTALPTTISGTANQITASAATGPVTLSFATAGVTLPGKTTLTASTTSAASANLPSGSAPTTPASGDLWNETGSLKFNDGSSTKTMTFSDGSVANDKVVITDSDASPVANRQLQVKQGKLQAADTVTGTEGRYISNDSLEQIDTPAIGDAQVTYPKMQSFSAASKLLGRGSAAGAGAPQEISPGAGLQIVGTELVATASGIPLDLGNDSVPESSGLTAIATTGDTNSIFTEPSADKLLIDVGQNWPTADVANDVSCTGCVETAAMAEDIATQAELDAHGLTEASTINKTIVGAICGVEPLQIRDSASTGAGHGGLSICYNTVAQKTEISADCEGGDCALDFAPPTNQDLNMTVAGTGKVNLTVAAADSITYTQGATTGSMVPVLKATATLTGLTGASVTATSLIPANAKVLWVRGRNDSAVTCAGGINIGDSNLATLWASAASADNAAETDYASGGQATGEVIYPAGSDVVVGCQGGSFGGGNMTVMALYTLLPGF